MPRSASERANFDAVWSCLGLVSARIECTGEAALGIIERTVWLVMHLDMQVLNGGFNQYFFNDTGDVASEAAAAFGRIGAHRRAEIVSQAVGLFPAPGPSTDHALRIRELEQLGEQGEDALAALTDKFYECPDDVETLLAAYIRAHEKEFQHLHQDPERLMADGAQRGLAKALEAIRAALPSVFAARAMPLSELGRARIASCEDLTMLERWLNRSAVATSEADVFAGSEPT